MVEEAARVLDCFTSFVNDHLQAVRLTAGAAFLLSSVLTFSRVKGVYRFTSVREIPQVLFDRRAAIRSVVIGVRPENSTLAAYHRPLLRELWRKPLSSELSAEAVRHNENFPHDALLCRPFCVEMWDDQLCEDWLKRNVVTQNVTLTIIATCIDKKIDLHYPAEKDYLVCKVRANLGHSIWHRLRHKDLGEEMVSLGLGKVNSEGSKGSEGSEGFSGASEKLSHIKANADYIAKLSKLELEAKSARRGMWANLSGPPRSFDRFISRLARWKMK